MNRKLSSIATVVVSIIASLVAMEIGIRVIYYQRHAQYALGLHQFVDKRLMSLLRSGSMGLELNRQSWEATYQERLLPIPPRGPREGHWGMRIAPKNYEN
jgi:hypothetical protein